MTILLTNDDGVAAAGIRALHVALKRVEKVVVVAPSNERSGASHALTMHDALRARSLGDDRWSVSGTPVDCVYVAVHELLEERPRLVISGINRGANLGDDVHYSGTVGAAREGALIGLPSLAVSLHVDHKRGERPVGSPHFDTAVHFTLLVLERLAKNPLPEGVFLNLNVPDVPLKDVRGLRVCVLGRRHYIPMVESRRDPRNRSYFWIGGEPVEGQMATGSDGWWADQTWATLTPIKLDTTAHGYLDSLHGFEVGSHIV
jgi:5'-nucleotidase